MRHSVPKQHPLVQDQAEHEPNRGYWWFYLFLGDPRNKTMQQLLVSLMSLSKLCSQQRSPVMKTNISNISGTIQIYTASPLWPDFRSQDQRSEIQYNTYSNYNIWYIPLFCKDLRKNNKKIFYNQIVGTHSFQFYSISSTRNRANPLFSSLVL